MNTHTNKQFFLARPGAASGAKAFPRQPRDRFENPNARRRGDATPAEISANSAGRYQQEAQERSEGPYESFAEGSIAKATRAYLETLYSERAVLEAVIGLIQEGEVSLENLEESRERILERAAFNLRRELAKASGPHQTSNA
ncbi:hypothetical protein [Acidimangrovimonas pyrenivorans]|uniref:Uncharacterized protein n=1 Tax=Acidimangrovimonas pyrenivorans TaxID=2030798 RepID=A0ABV7AMI2_9RHOB